MKRIIYTLIAILVIILVVGIALISKNVEVKPNPSGEALTKLTVSEVTHSVFYAPQR